MTDWTKGILDTDTFILRPRLPDASILPGEPLITAITMAELEAGSVLADSQDKSDARQAHVDYARTHFNPLPFDREASKAFAKVAYSLWRAGQKTRGRMADALNASVALARDLAIYTCNPGDYQAIESLIVIQVEHPDAGSL